MTCHLSNKTHVTHLLNHIIENYMNYMIQSYIQLLQPKFKAMPLATDFPQFRFWTPPVPFQGIPG